MELLVLVIGLAALGLLAHRFGYDSRDGFDTKSRGLATSASGWSNPFSDRELARETLEARQRRITNNRAVTAHPQPADRDRLHAA